MQTVDLENANAEQMWRVIEDMQYRSYALVRSIRPDKPLSYFEAGWPMEQVIAFENRYKREAK